jgi:plasmid stabilization system protein ParE
MNFYVNFSEKAEFDILNIVEYIAEEKLNPQAAKRFHENINEKADLISRNPFIYPLSRNEKFREKGYRNAFIGNYLMFYRVDENDKIITITGVIYARRDLTEIDI